MKKRYLIVIAVGVFALAFSSFVKTTFNSAVTTPSPDMTALNPSAPTGTTIVIDSPSSGATVTFPVTVTGRASASWFPSGSFPVYAEDMGGAIFAAGTAQATTTTYTDNFIPFEATLDYTTYYREAPHGKGYLIFKSTAGLSTDTKVISIKF